MASYTVDWIRSTTFLDNAREAVNGFQVRITMQPWNEARDLYVLSDTAEVIDEAAKQAVRNREAVAKLTNVEIKEPKKK